jgi:hypothetical protein
MIVPLRSDYIEYIGPHDVEPLYVITAPNEKLEGFKVEFKNLSGQVSSTDNGDGAAWTMTGTGLVDRNEKAMAALARTLSNLGGKYLVFFPTGKTDSNGKEWKVVGNEFGDCNIEVTGDTGKNRNDEHGLTFTVTCNFQVYPMMWWYGNIDEAQASVSSGDDESDMVKVPDAF